VRYTLPMPAASPDALARARLQGKRAALGVVIVVAVVFIGASAVQIVPAIFGAGVTPIPVSPSGSDPRVCAEGVRRLERALERAHDTAGSLSFGPDEERVRSACDKSPEGLDAWASLARLRSAEEQLAPAAGSAAAELEPLRRDVAAHLPADLR
jgi:hypothetical protein